LYVTRQRALSLQAAVLASIFLSVLGTQNHGLCPFIMLPAVANNFENLIRDYTSQQKKDDRLPELCETMEFQEVF
jgi:hypothetical protein